MLACVVFALQSKKTKDTKKLLQNAFYSAWGKEFLNEISRLKQENSKDDIRDNKKLKSIQEFFDEEFKKMRKQIEENAKRWHKLDLKA